MDSIVYIVTICVAGMVFLIMSEASDRDFIKWYKLLSSGLRSHINNCRKAFHIGDGWDTPPLLVLVISIIGSFMVSLLICGSLGLYKSFSFVWAYFTLSSPYWVSTFLKEPGDD